MLPDTETIASVQHSDEENASYHQISTYVLEFFAAITNYRKMLLDSCIGRKIFLQLIRYDSSLPKLI